VCLLSSIVSHYQNIFSKKKKKSIENTVNFSRIFNFCGGEFKFLTARHKQTFKESAVNGPFIGGAKWKVWNLASRKYRDPLEAGMKSVSLASQLCLSIHNPAPKPQPRAAWHSHGAPDQWRPGLCRFMEFSSVPYSPSWTETLRQTARSCTRLRRKYLFQQAPSYAS